MRRAKEVAEELGAKRAAAAEGAKDPRRTAGRGSTTDPDARSMKMPDGGYRPGYNVQAASTTADGFAGRGARGEFDT